MSIADVRRWRKLAGISQKQAADLLSYSVTHYRLIELEERPMPDGFDQRFARKLTRHCEHVIKTLRIEGGA